MLTDARQVGEEQVVPGILTERIDFKGSCSLQFTWTK